MKSVRLEYNFELGNLKRLAYINIKENEISNIRSKKVHSIISKVNAVIVVRKMLRHNLAKLQQKVQHF